MKRSKALSMMRKTAKRIAHEKLKETLPQEEQKKLTGDEVINYLYLRNRQGYLELSPLCYKYHYKKLKEAYDFKTN